MTSLFVAAAGAAADAVHDRRRNEITRAIGAGSDGQADYWMVPAEPGDVVFAAAPNGRGLRVTFGLVTATGRAHDDAADASSAAALSSTAEDLAAWEVDAPVHRGRLRGSVIVPVLLRMPDQSEVVEMVDVRIGLVSAGFDADLVVPSEVVAEIAMLKAVAYTYMMNTEHRLELMERQREALQALVAMWERHPERMDPQYLEDRRVAEEAGDDAAARRAVVDQVASLSDGRAWVEHHRWCTHHGH